MSQMISINLAPSALAGRKPVDLVASLVTGFVVLICLSLAILTVAVRVDASTVKVQLSTKQTELKQRQKALEIAQGLQQSLATISDRGKLVKQLDSQQLDGLAIIDSLSKTAPTSLKLTTVTVKTGQLLTLIGTAATRADTTSFINNLETTKLYKAINLAQANSQPEGISFTITAQLMTPSPTQSPR